MNIISFTQEGYDNLLKEQENLKQERIDAVEHLKRAREMGDLSENGYYKASKMKLVSIDRRLKEISHLFRYGKVVIEKKGDAVTIGSRVTVHDGKEYLEFKIVGDYEANPSEGKLSTISPIGKALHMKKVGDIVTVATPMGIKKIRIEKIQ